MYDAMVYKRHRNHEMESTAGAVNNCSYDDKACMLVGTGGHLIWETSQREHCHVLCWKVVTERCWVSTFSLMMERLVAHSRAEKLTKIAADL